MKTVYLKTKKFVLLLLGFNIVTCYLKDGTIQSCDVASDELWLELVGKPSNNVWSRLKLLVGKIKVRVMSRFSGSH